MLERGEPSRTRGTRRAVEHFGTVAVEHLGTVAVKHLETVTAEHRLHGR